MLRTSETSEFFSQKKNPRSTIKQKSFPFLFLQPMEIHSFLLHIMLFSFAISAVSTKIMFSG